MCSVLLRITLINKTEHRLWACLYSSIVLAWYLLLLSDPSISRIKEIFISVTGLQGRINVWWQAGRHRKETLQSVWDAKVLMFSFMTVLKDLLRFQKCASYTVKIQPSSILKGFHSVLFLKVFISLHLCFFFQQHAFPDDSARLLRAHRGCCRLGRRVGHDFNTCSSQPGKTYSMLHAGPI